MLERIKRMLVKEFLQLNRDPRMKAVILVVPIVQSLVFGYAVSTDVRHVATAFYDLDQSRESRELVSRFTGSGYFDAIAYPQSDAEAQRLIDSGTARVVFRFNRGFGETLRSGRTAPLQVVVDGSDSNTAAIILTYANRVVSRFSETVLAERARKIGIGDLPQPLELRTRTWFNANLESRNFYVPGVVALLVTLVTLMLTSMAIVREKEVGTIEQIVVTPIRKFEFILGKSVPFILIAFVDVLLIAAIAVLWFRIPIRGSLVLLLGGTALFLISAVSIGLLISTVSSTQQQAMMTTFFFFMPAILLSGFMFPIANMPRMIQWLTLLNPLRYFLVIIRGIFLKGVGVAVLWPQMLGLLVIGSLLLVVASSRFKKTLA